MGWRCRMGWHKWLILEDNDTFQLLQCQRCLAEGMEVKDE